MATGDLVVKDGQYEFQGILFNNGPWTRPTRIVEEMRGLWGYDQKTSDVEIQADHGSFLGDDYVAAKTLEMKLKVDCTDAAQANNEILLLGQAWQPQRAEIPLVFQKPGIGKKLIYVRPRDIDLPSDYAGAKGLLTVNARLYAADPRIYAFTEKIYNATIAAGSSSAQVTAVNDGTFTGGTFPIITITGPTLNPRIANSGDNGRTLRLDGSLSAGQTLTIDTFFRTVTIGSVDEYDWVRTDNQWFRLRPGNNVITYSRGNTTGESVMTVRFRDAWI